MFSFSQDPAKTEVKQWRQKAKSSWTEKGFLNDLHQIPLQAKAESFLWLFIPLEIFPYVVTSSTL